MIHNKLHGTCLVHLSAVDAFRRSASEQGCARPLYTSAIHVVNDNQGRAAVVPPSMSTTWPAALSE